MGASLYSIHVHSENREELRQAAEAAAAATGATFFIGPVRRGWIPLILEYRFWENGSAALIDGIAAPMFFCVVADDDDFRYEFYRENTLADRYSSQPEAYASDIPASERDQWRGQPEKYGDLLGSPAKIDQCRELLAKNRNSASESEDMDDKEFVFESQRLVRFAKLLGFSSVEVAYDDFEDPENVSLRRRFTRIPDDTEAKTARRKEIARSKAEYRELRRTGVLVMEFRPPVTKGDQSSPFVAWVQNPQDFSLLVQWGQHGFKQSPPRLYSAPDFTETRPLPENFPARIGLAEFCRSRRYLAMGGISVWEWPKREIGLIPFNVASLHFDQEGRILYGVNHREIIAIEVAEFREIARVSKLDASCFAVHPSGEVAVVGSSEGRLSVSELPSMLEIKRFITHRGSAGTSSGFLKMNEALSAAREGREEARELLVQVIATLHDADVERFVALKFSPDGKWLFSGSHRGMRAWCWSALATAEGFSAPSPNFHCDARPAEHGEQQIKGCNALAFDDVNHRLLFAGLEGIVEHLDLTTGALGILLHPPKLAAIYRLALSVDGQNLIVQSRELKSNCVGDVELRIWNYPALCSRAGLSNG